MIIDIHVTWNATCAVLKIHRMQKCDGICIVNIEVRCCSKISITVFFYRFFKSILTKVQDTIFIDVAQGHHLVLIIIDVMHIFIYLYSHYIFFKRESILQKWQRSSFWEYCVCMQTSIIPCLCKIDLYDMVDSFV